MQTFRVAIVGYGNAGRIFHAPLISGVPGLLLAVIASSKAASVNKDWPGVRVVRDPEEVFMDKSIDVVVIATSNQSHYPLARAALLSGKHVVVDKPCTVTLAETDDLLQLAASQKLILTVFQNRRLDADFLALQQVLASGDLGQVLYFESHFDRFRPFVPDRWRDNDLPGSGLWFDLGVHLLDQTIQLFGTPTSIMVDMAAQREGAVVNDYFHAQLRFDENNPNLRVVLHASSMVHALGPRFVVHGTRGSFVKFGFDVQENDLKAGARPILGSLENWGRDSSVAVITLNNDQVERTYAGPDIPGNYLDYYVKLRDHLNGRLAVPFVSREQVRLTMQLLSLGQQSALEGAFLPVIPLT